MDHNPNKNLSQLIKQTGIYFPNEAQLDLHRNARQISQQYGVLPYRAKLIAEKQGYDLGDA